MKNQVKLICIDVDGTLVDSTKAVPQKNKQAIRRAFFEKGVKIAILSGRIEPSVRSYMEILGIKGAIPSLGGCLVRDENGQVIYENTLDKDAALDIYNVSNELGCAFFYYYHDKWSINPGQDYWKASEEKATSLKGEMLDLEPVIKKQAPNKILGVNENVERLLELKKYIETKHGDKIDCILSQACFMEIVPKNTNKGTAVIELCKYYKIQPEEAMAIGDYYNDIDMFKAAGISVAMANAPEDIKKMTTYCTENDNGHCGVAEAIEKFVLN